MAGCSTLVVMISLRSGCAFNAERIAVESDSVPQEVKMISDSCSAPSNSCTCMRAFLIARPTLLPKLCIDEGLPNCSVKYGSMASTTASSTRVVALLSKQMPSIFDSFRFSPRPFTGEGLGDNQRLARLQV